MQQNPTSICSCVQDRSFRRHLLEGCIELGRVTMFTSSPLQMRGPGWRDDHTSCSLLPWQDVAEAR